MTPNPKTRNGGKWPQILKHEKAENDPNPKTWNGGNLPQILKHGTANFLLSFHAMRNSHDRDTLQTSLHLVLLKSQNLFVDEKTLVLKGS